MPTEPRLEPLFGILPFTPKTTCLQIHPHGPIPRGSKVVCMGCHRTGIEGNRVFRRDAMDRNGSRTWPIRGEIKLEPAADPQDKPKRRKRRAAARTDRHVEVVEA